MSNVEALTEAINRILFASEQPVVVALKGGWGEGKTHFWKNTIVAARKDVAIGYVSVFGADSIQAIRERVVLSATPKLPNEGKSVFGRAVETIRQNAASVIKGIGVPEALLIQLVENWALKPGWIVCLDDIERLSDKVGVDVLLGYINELRDERKLKIVLIYNNEGTATNTDAFRRYQEKVIDKELPFSPDVSDTIRLVFRETLDPLGNKDLYLEIARRCEVLNLKNIRLLAKVRNYYDELDQILPSEADASFRTAALYSILLFVWVKFSNAALPSLTLDFLANYSELATLIDDDAERQQAENGLKRSKELLSKFGYAYTDDLDKLLIRLVRTDLLDIKGIKEEYEKYTRNATTGFYDSNYRKVWQEHYHGTFRDNEVQFCESLINATREYLPLIPINQLDSALTMLGRLGREQEADALLNDFLRLRAASLNGGTRRNLIEPLRSQKLAEILEKKEKEADVDVRPIGDVIKSALADDFPRSKDRKRLAEFSAEEYANYFLTTDQDGLTSSIRELGNIANRIVNPSEEDVRIQAAVREAALQIAGRSRMNRLRMESMGLITKQPD